MISINFNSNFAAIGGLPSFTDDQIKAEPLFFRAEPDYAYEHGGPVTRAFIDALIECRVPSIDKQEIIVFDSRSHMLMPGWYPSIPGWHHDSVERTYDNGQPNYIDPEHRADHVFALVANSDTLCQTEFAIGEFELELPPLGSTIYKEWHPQVESLIQNGTLKSERVLSNRLYYFDDRAWHQAVAATERGFRWFGRLTFGSPMSVRNEIRMQTQVYLPHPMEGW